MKKWSSSATLISQSAAKELGRDPDTHRNAPTPSSACPAAERARKKTRSPEKTMPENKSIFCFLFLSSSLLSSSHFLSASPSLDVTQIPGVTKHALLPPPHYGTRLRFYREETPAISSHVDSHRIAPTHAARRSQQLLLLFFYMGYKLKNPAYVGFEIQNELY